MYIFFILILFIFSMIILLLTGDREYIVYGVPCIPICIVMLIIGLKRPKVYIYIDDNGNLQLYNGTMLQPSDIADVSYHEYYRFRVFAPHDVGELILKTVSGESFRFSNVADCETSCKELVNIIYKAKCAPENNDGIKGADGLNEKI